MRTMFGLVFLMSLIGFVANESRGDDHEGPHKGIVVEWGEEEYHVELVVDRKAGSVVAYIYGDEKSLKNGKAKAIDAKSITLALKTTPPTTIKLAADPAKGDPKDKSSKFTAKDDALKGDAKLAGTVAGKVGNKPFSGEFKQK